jgi:hypothetical protein
MLRAKLSARVSAADEPLVRRLYSVDALFPPNPHLPGRLVVDATAATTEIAFTARRAGIPFLVDPQTYFLQDVQADADRWAQLPFATADALTPADLASAKRREALVEQLFQFQLDAHASALIAPYLHIDQPDSAWIDIQASLWHTTRRLLDQHGLDVPVVAVVALDWRCLQPIRGVPLLEPLWLALRALGPSEVALAASKVHLGRSTNERLVELLLLVEKLSRTYRVIAWQQGLLGEACVAAGATGYETGIGWREHCDLQQVMTSRRRLPGPTGARPVYFADLGRSIPKKTVQAVKAHNTAAWRAMICADADCCAPGGRDLLGDSRHHTVIARSTALDALSDAARPEWTWGILADRAIRGLDLGKRINAIAATPVDLRALEAVHAVATARRHRRPTRRTA